MRVLELCLDDTDPAGVSVYDQLEFLKSFFVDAPVLPILTHLWIGPCEEFLRFNHLGLFAARSLRTINPVASKDRFYLLNEVSQFLDSVASCAPWLEKLDFSRGLSDPALVQHMLPLKYLRHLKIALHPSSKDEPVSGPDCMSLKSLDIIGRASPLQGVVSTATNILHRIDLACLEELSVDLAVIQDTTLPLTKKISAFHGSLKSCRVTLTDLSKFFPTLTDFTVLSPLASVRTLTVLNIGTHLRLTHVELVSLLPSWPNLAILALGSRNKDTNFTLKTLAEVATHCPALGYLTMPFSEGLGSKVQSPDDTNETQDAAETMPALTQPFPPRRDALLQLVIPDTKLHDNLDEVITFLMQVYPKADVDKWPLYRRVL